MIASISAARPSASPIRRAWSSHGEKYSGAPAGWAIVGAIAGQQRVRLLVDARVGADDEVGLERGDALVLEAVGVRRAPSGSASPSSSCAHGHVANGWSPYQSVTPIGVTPSASTVSCSVTPTVTTRCGSASTTVVPSACSTVTGNAASAPAEPLSWLRSSRRGGGVRDRSEDRRCRTRRRDGERSGCGEAGQPAARTARSLTTSSPFVGNGGSYPYNKCSGDRSAFRFDRSRSSSPSAGELSPGARYLAGA